MAEQAAFPKTLFSKDEQQNQVKDSVTGEVLCGSKVFNSQEEVDAAGGNAVWKATPQEAQQSGQQPPAGQPRQPGQHPAPPVRLPQPEPAHDDDDDEGVPSPTVPRRR